MKIEIKEFDKKLLERIRNVFGVWDSDAMKVAMEVRKMSNEVLESNENTP